MIPMILRIKIFNEGEKKRSIFIPLAILWLILLALFVLLLPIFLIAALIAWAQGYGRVVAGMIPGLFRVFGALKGLSFEIGTHQKLVAVSIV
jgi:hypothetical protein